MPTTAQLKTAYQRTALQREGISFDAAMQSPMFKTCLTHVAEALDSIKQPPLPKHHCQPKWQPYKDD